MNVNSNNSNRIGIGENAGSTQQMVGTFDSRPVVAIVDGIPVYSRSGVVTPSGQLLLDRSCDGDSCGSAPANSDEIPDLEEYDTDEDNQIPELEEYDTDEDLAAAVKEINSQVQAEANKSGFGKDI